MLLQKFICMYILRYGINFMKLCSVCQINYTNGNMANITNITNNSNGINATNTNNGNSNSIPSLNNNSKNNTNSSINGNATNNMSNQPININIITVDDAKNNSWHAFSTQPISSYILDNFMNKTVDDIVTLFQSSLFLQAAQKVVEVVAVASSNSIARRFIQPMLSILNDFWFYPYHTIRYPQFVDQFTSQMDLFSQFRIKPGFLNFDIEFPVCENQNQLYTNQSILQSRAPDTIFVLQSVKDIYTINIATVVGQFMLLKIFRFVLKLTKHKSKILYKLYRFLSINSVWWTLIIAIVECNITQVIFYSSIQFNQFISFNFLSKVGLIVTLVFFLLVFLYSFLFYPFLHQFEKFKYSEHAYDLSIYSPGSYWLQVSLKCFRSFFEALIHGIFINRQPFQLLGLISLDICLVISTIYFLKFFKHKICFILIFLYFLSFLCFDIILMLYTVQLNNDTYTSQKQIRYNFALAIVVLAILGISCLRVILQIVMEIIQQIKQLLKSNQISEEITQEKQNMKLKKVFNNKCIFKLPNSLMQQKQLCKNKYTIKKNKIMTEPSNPLSETTLKEDKQIFNVKSKSTKKFIFNLTKKIRNKNDKNQFKSKNILKVNNNNNQFLNGDQSKFEQPTQQRNQQLQKQTNHNKLENKNSKYIFKTSKDV